MLRTSPDYTFAIWAFALFVGTFLGAVILRSACGLYNKIAGGPLPNGVPEPSYGLAVGITFLATLGQLIATFAIGLLVDTYLVDPVDLMQGRGPGFLADAVRRIAPIPAGAFILTVLLAGMLPTGLVRGLLITTFYLLISILILGFLFAVLAGSAFIFSR